MSLGGFQTDQGENNIAIKLLGVIYSVPFCQIQQHSEKNMFPFIATTASAVYFFSFIVLQSLRPERTIRASCLTSCRSQAIHFHPIPLHWAPQLQLNQSILVLPASFFHFPASFLSVSWVLSSSLPSLQQLPPPCGLHSHLLPDSSH